MRKKRPSRHQMNIEIKMLEAERNRAIWERDRLAVTVENLLGRLELLGRWTTEILEQAAETVEDQFNRDGSATDAPRRSGTGATSSPT